MKNKKSTIGTSERHMIVLDDRTFRLSFSVNGRLILTVVLPFEQAALSFSFVKRVTLEGRFVFLNGQLFYY
jgi:hypothetical protein